MAGNGTSIEPYLARIRIFPVKSLDALEVSKSRVLKSGALEHDRRWALFDKTGDYINGKRYRTIHRLRSSISPSARTLSLKVGSEAGESRFEIDQEHQELERWLAGYFDTPVDVREDTEQGFPDDPASPGPTVISVASLREVGGWFGLPVEDIRERFRANIEIDGVPAFWEDRLFGPPGTVVPFRIGNVTFDGVNPCQRCAVPPRDSRTGREDETFVRRFRELRKRTLPEWALASRFTHFYRLAVNTRLNSLDHGDVIHVGERIELLAPDQSRV
ncbi:MAG: MOSC N-terminal beta barrel domain-containing protein [Proteobacteria bacterium]|nr:MOSC N-terminal beta barrel domain-containing protein [Pseudomonadota bacterium]